MKQGIHTAARVRLLFSKGHSCYRPRRTGERKRKSVRGCVVSQDLSVLNLVVVKKGDKDIEGLTDTIKPRRHGPKRASKIRKLFNLGKEDDVREYNLRRKIAKEGQKAYYKSPKIQRLITPQRLQRKRHERHVKRERYEASKAAAVEYNALIAARFKDQRDKRAQALQKRRSASTSKSATSTSTSGTTTTTTASTTTATPSTTTAQRTSTKKDTPSSSTASTTSTTSGSSGSSGARKSDKKDSTTKKTDTKKAPSGGAGGSRAKKPATTTTATPSTSAPKQ